MMTKKTLRLLVIFLVELIVLSQAPPANVQMADPVPLTNLKAGVASVDITPPIGIPLAGYTDRKGPSTGIHDPLHAVVIVFDDGKTRVAIVSLDVIQVLQSEGNDIIAAIKKATGIPGSHVIVNASHTHASPWLQTDVNYEKEVVAKAAGAVTLATSRLRPVSLGYGEGKIDFNINRRVINAQGKCRPGLNPDGICDHRVKVLRIDDGDSVEPMAVIMHAVCHANVFTNTNTEISGDFPGIAKAFVDHSFGRQTTTLFLQGCAGDIRPNLPGSGFGRSGSEGDMTWCAWTLGAEVVRVATKLRVREQVSKRETSFRIAVAQEILKLKGNKEKLKEVLYPREHVVNDEITFPVQVMKIGNIWFVALPGEPVVEYGLQIEKAMKSLGHVFVLGYSAGDEGYIPVKHMFSEGGYEAQGPYQTSCQEKILECVHRLVAGLQDK